MAAHSTLKLVAAHSDSTLKLVAAHSTLKLVAAHSTLKLVAAHSMLKLVAARSTLEEGWWLRTSWSVVLPQLLAVMGCDGGGKRPVRKVTSVVALLVWSWHSPLRWWVVMVAETGRWDKY